MMIDCIWFVMMTQIKQLRRSTGGSSAGLDKRSRAANLVCNRRASATLEPPLAKLAASPQHSLAAGLA